EPGLTPQLRCIEQEERTAAVIEQPLGLHPGLERAIRESVRLEMILLPIVHRDEQPLRFQPCDAKQREEQRYTGAQPGTRAQRGSGEPTAAKRRAENSL